MTSKRTIRQVAVALILLVAFLLQGTWALAGTTGGLGGYVTDDQGKAVAGASVKVLSASQAASATTDASGHFTLLALAPDTYTVSIVKDGFAPFSEAGITVFADNQLALQFQLARQLKTIANVTSTAAGALVKSGVGSDIYNVNSAAIQAAASLGGGSNLNSAYSAISAVPGVAVTIGGMGWNQNVFVRGSQSFFTGYEYDGVPVNRAFDNYNASTESSLGLQELQVYTGGGPASNSSSGTSGFINQVIKTGTYPGYANASGGIASSAFYHEAKIEAGGASPDRNFSYYVGISGYNQDFRLIDNNNGVGLMGPGGIFSDYSATNAGLAFGVATDSGAYAQCSTADGSTPASVYGTPASPTGVPAGTPWCLSSYTGLAANTSMLNDRENVINFHFGIPRKDGQRDDVQVLWNVSLIKTSFYSTVNDIGGYNAYMLAMDGFPYAAPTNGQCNPGYNANATGNCPGYVDTYTFNAPFGTPAAGLTPSLYYEPDSPTDRVFDAQLPTNSPDTVYNNQAIMKVQYTHSIGDNAYARLMGYTFFSDWNLAGPTTTVGDYIYGNPVGATANNYLLGTHTYGGEFQFSDQINDKNLLQFTTNLTNANVMRDNNTTNVSAGVPFGIVSNAGGNYTCWSSAANGDAPVPCYTVTRNCTAGASTTTTCNASNVEAGEGYPTVGPAAAAAGASLETLWDGPETASYNTVNPKFLNVSLSDQWRPSDRWLINGAIRYESYTYDLPQTETPGDQFYAQIAANNFCYNTTPGQQGVYSAPLLPGQFPPASPIEIPQTTDCNAYISGITGSPVTGYVHPNGTTQDGVAAPSFTSSSPSSYGLNYWSARYSATYTESPDTVWRFSGGRFIEPPISASIQYTNKSGNNTAQWANFMDLGFFTPFHNTPSQTSGQYDLSLERHIRGTDMSFKITPFYNLTNGYQEQSFIGPGYVTQVPVGRFRSEGVEGAFTKGDFSKNGLSGSLSVTYTKAQVQYQSGLVNNLGANQIGYYNTAIQNYNALAKGGAQNYPCFTFAAGGAAGTGIGTPGVAATCAAGTTTNPYFSAPAQGLLDPNGWYAPASDVALPGVNTALGLYDIPWETTLLLNWRHDRFAVTPSLQLATGASYGSPFTVEGVDPRLCTSNDPSVGAPVGQCNYATVAGQGATPTGLLYIPNPQTGSFDNIGQYHNPNIMVGNIAFSYDLSPRITVNLTVANVFHTCFGGSKEPWTTAYPPSTNICSYGANSFYVSNYQNGAGFSTPGNPSSYSAAANGTTLQPWQQQSYAPGIGSVAGVLPPPLNAYLTFNVKL
jgi:Carboxypeptidase regulatory-like domain/TonB-dependent Receptor Plug Domain